jgi:murein L,D-transpeptidase YcbB/YkuD
VVSGAEPETVVLPNPVPVHIQYWTSWVDNEGQLQFRNDLYNRDARLIDQLRKTAEGDTRYTTPVSVSNPERAKL